MIKYKIWWINYKSEKEMKDVRWMINNKCWKINYKRSIKDEW